jgi:hypothetical protein
VPEQAVSGYVAIFNFGLVFRRGPVVDLVFSIGLLGQGHFRPGDRLHQLMKLKDHRLCKACARLSAVNQFLAFTSCEIERCGSIFITDDFISCGLAHLILSQDSLGSDL